MSWGGWIMHSIGTARRAIYFFYKLPMPERRTAGCPFKFRDSSNWNASTTMVDFTIMLSCWHANWTKLDLTLFNATRQFKGKKRKLKKNCQIIYNPLSLRKKTRNKIFIRQSFKSCSRVQSLQKKKKRLRL